MADKEERKTYAVNNINPTYESEEAKQKACQEANYRIAVADRIFGKKSK